MYAQRNHKCLAFSLYCLLVILQNIYAQNFYTSNAKFLGLVESEHIVMNMLKDYITATRKKIDTLQSYVDRYEEVYSEMRHSSAEIGNNPVHNYLLLRRTTIDLDIIENVLLTDTAYEVMFNVSEMQENDELPSIEDLEGAAEGIDRLQKTYQIDHTSLADGNLLLKPKPLPTNLKLTARDCLYVGKIQVNMKKFENGMAWYKAAKNRTSFADGFSARTTDEEIQSYLDDLNQMKKNSSLVAPKRDVLTENYEKLCRGEKIETTVLERELSCRYFKGHHPYYLLQPVKLEVVSKLPFIALLHDVLSNKETKEFRIHAWPKMNRSLLYDPNGKSKPGSARTSSNGWVQSNSGKLLSKVTRKSEMLLGLNAGINQLGSESYQVTNYGIGGHYGPHKDFLQRPDGTFSATSKIGESGDRIATLMYYLSDVEAGGATAFPNIGIAIWPKKGSAAFWWNLFSDGSGDKLTVHGACPVLLGNKWISNKWFRSHHQTFLKKCKLNPKEAFLDV